MNPLQKASLCILLGIIGLAVWFFMDTMEAASDSQRLACEATVQSRYEGKTSEEIAPMLKNCEQANFAIAITAKNAHEASRAISVVNRSALSAFLLRSFALGSALSFLAAGGILMFIGIKKKKV